MILSALQNYELAKKKMQEAEQAKLDNRKMIDNTMFKAQGLMQGAGVLGNVLSATSAMPGQEPNVKQSTIGGAMSGLSSGMAFGPFGAVLGAAVGGLSGYMSGNKSLDEHLMGLNQEQEMNMMSKTIQPTSYEKGGFVGGSGIQTEKGEMILLPETMQLVMAAAKKKHKDMKPNEITDFVPNTAIVFSNKKKFDPKKIKDKVLGYGPGHYEEDETYAPEKITVGDIFGNKKVTFAEAANKLRKRIPVKGDDSKDIFDEITDAENKVTRMMYLKELIAAQEGGETPITESDEVPMFYDGGQVGAGISKKYYADVMKKLKELEGLNKTEYDSGMNDLSNLQRRLRGSVAGKAGIETLFTALQNPNVRPVVQDNTFINDSFQQLPLSFIDSQVSPIRGSVNSLANSLLRSGVNPRDLPAMLAGSQGRALDAEAGMRSKLILDRVNTDRGKYQALRQNLTQNRANVVNAENATNANYNQRYRNFGKILSDSVGDFAELEASGMRAGRNLRKSYLDNDISLFRTRADIAGNQMKFDDNMRRINDRLSSLQENNRLLQARIDRAPRTTIGVGPDGRLSILPEVLNSLPQITPNVSPMNFSRPENYSTQIEDFIMSMPQIDLMGPSNII